MLVIDVALDPTIIQIGGIQLTWHGIISTLALLVAVQVGLVLARQSGLPEGPLRTVVAWAIPAGIVGARLFHVLDHLADYSAEPVAALFVWRGGLAAYGAFLGGLVGALLAARREGLPIWRLLDVAAPALLIGQAIGRIGCFINGDAVGRATGGSWGVVYSHPDALVPASLQGVPTHPYPLYELGWDLGVLACLILVRRAGHRQGDVFLIAALGYALGRYVLSYARIEPQVAWGLQEAQLIAIGTGIIVGVLFIWRRTRWSLRRSRPSQGLA